MNLGGSNEKPQILNEGHSLKQTLAGHVLIVQIPFKETSRAEVNTAEGYKGRWYRGHFYLFT